MWWRRSGLLGLHEKTVDPRQVGTDGKIGENFPLVQGKHYFADYNVSAIKEPAGYKTPHKPLFRYIDPAQSKYHIELLSFAPRVLYVKNFLTMEECDELRRLAEPLMFRSSVSAGKNDEKEHEKIRDVVQDARTSDQAWLYPEKYTAARDVIARIYHLTGFAEGTAEPMQVLRYQLGQQYFTHDDFFAPGRYGKQTSNRAATVFLYLTDVDEGGETHFPYASGKPGLPNTKCNSQGLRVAPRKGNAVLFYDMRPNHMFDWYSSHGGCPVKKGIKIAGTVWLRVQTP